MGGNNYAKEYAYHLSGRPTSIVYETNNSVTATETMTWDKESRMLTNSLANSSYVYNGFDARISKTVGANTTTFKRAGADPVSPVLSDVTGANTARYLPGISSRVGSTSTFNHSGIKNGILQTNSSQSNTATKRYDAFGNELSTTGTWQTRFDYGGGFGYQTDPESSYKLLGHRYYDPEIGRFLTRDPIKDGRNWYGYCWNAPVAAGDPDGLRPITAQDIGRLHKLRGAMATEGLNSSYINQITRELKLEIENIPVVKVYCNGSRADPTRLRALWWALDRVGDKESGGLCKVFVTDAYAIGAGTPMPDRRPWVPFRRYPYGANAYANPSKKLMYFSIAESAQPGDVVAFPRQGGAGHMALKVGSGLLVYGGNRDSKVGTFAKNRESAHGPGIKRTYRFY